MAKELTKKQLVFVHEYLTDLNGARAYIAAGYSPNGAEAGAARLVANVKVKAYIEQKLEKKLSKLDISVENVLTEIAKLAFLDPRKLFNPDGSPKKIQELDDNTAASVAGLEVEEICAKGRKKSTSSRVTKIRIADKGVNLERLGRYLKLFTDKIEVDVTDDVVARLAAARKRAGKK